MFAHFYGAVANTVCPKVFNETSGNRDLCAPRQWNSIFNVLWATPSVDRDGGGVVEMIMLL